MKNYKITVNGTTYDVAVEEVGGASAPAAGGWSCPSGRCARRRSVPSYRG